ncbi:MAG TPA: STAS/SEC14 domain-containing protein [Smithella sp.]|nr:hypothetical protein [Smithella sp.]MDM7986561.1 STAS/SEC14 domain-containing protein [Smithella sp.]HNY51029.1 STAS/SEC14 domain-containing protein [Smithella sp.]HOG91137.1 STAS/SEC14 domain-containing protein [Smithella sp.]HOU50372.1 STAS/SEC14 domain-containing protein [Smithella sp.]
MKNNTKYQMSTSVNDGIIEVVLTGELMDNEAEKMINELIAIQKSTKANKQILDVRKLRKLLGIKETYDALRNLPADRPKMKTAFVGNAENESYNFFVKATARNAGLIVNYFTDMEAARAWLKSKELDYYV